MITEQTFLKKDNICCNYNKNTVKKAVKDYPIPCIYTDTKTIEESRFKLIDIFRIKDYEVK